MNILLLNYGQADNNSAHHILGHARGLARRGHDVCVAVAKSVPDGVFETHGGWRMASTKTMLREGPCFANRERADVLHAWTPRETIRTFVEKFSLAWGMRALIIHQEDNEVAIFERFTGRSVEEAVAMEREWPKGLIHPGRYTPFMDSAQGLTLVHGCLEPLSPASLPRQELVPVMDLEFFSNGSRSDTMREQLGIPKSARIIAFNGNDHAATAFDIRQLYETVELLIERGRDVFLVRTGHVLPANYEGLQFRPGPRCIELGFIDRPRVPEVMRLADVVIQPGDADVFNSFRLPAKVPEYLCMSKPLIMGTANIGNELSECGAAHVLPRMSPQAMADATERLLDDPAEASALGERALKFARRRFAEEAVIPKLETFYAGCLAR